MRAAGVAGDRDDWDAAIQRLNQPGDEVRRTRPERAVANAGPVGDAGVGVGGEGAAALVVDEVVGSPARPRNEFFREIATLKKLARR
jgi:hypothetical protein